MARLILENLTPEQAKALADWFAGQGEQDSAVWLEERGVSQPFTNVGLANWRTIDKSSGDVVVKCYTPKED